MKYKRYIRSANQKLWNNDRGNKDLVQKEIHYVNGLFRQKFSLNWWVRSYVDDHKEKTWNDPVFRPIENKFKIDQNETISKKKHMLEFLWPKIHKQKGKKRIVLS